MRSESIKAASGNGRTVSSWVLICVAGALVLGSQWASGHHGWDSTEAETTELNGTIQEVRRGAPHGEITLDVAGVSWLVELGLPWRNQRAGLTMLTQGLEVRVIGHRSTQPEQNRLRAVRVVVDGRNYDLYPDKLR